eukprot:5655620-Alexandrium_andersonii.AAC.1
MSDARACINADMLGPTQEHPMGTTGLASRWAAGLMSKQAGRQASQQANKTPRKKAGGQEANKASKEASR